MTVLSLERGDEKLAPRRSEARRILVVFLSNRAPVIGATILAMIVFLAVSADWIAPYDPILVVPAESQQPPSVAHWMGTDLLGRDILSRVIYGARLSLLIGMVSVLLGSGLGTTVGLVAGYIEGWVETVIMRIVDAMLAFPGILLALAIIAGLGPSIRNVMLAVGIATVPQFARLTRGSVLSIKQNEYMLAARIMGCSAFRVVLRHILPNVIAPVIVLATLQFGVAILTAASLSFLGLGAQPPTPEWGLMVSVGRVYLGKAWWMSIFPGFSITVAVVGMNLVGDGLREALDPHLRNR